MQGACEAISDDTPDKLAARVFEQECIAYPHAIELFAEGRISIKKNVAKIVNDKEMAEIRANEELDKSLQRAMIDVESKRGRFVE